jgi:hypothetical protein
MSIGKILYRLGQGDDEQLSTKWPIGQMAKRNNQNSRLGPGNGRLALFGLFFLKGPFLLIAI